MIQRTQTPLKNYLNKLQQNSNMSYSILQNIENHPRRSSPQRLMNTFQISFVKDFEVLKMHVKSLQNQNRELLNEIDRIKHDKQLNEKSLIEKINNTQIQLMQFRKERNYHMDLIELKVQQEYNKLKKETEKQMQIIVKELNKKQNEIEMKNKYIVELQSKNNELSNSLKLKQNQAVYTKDNMMQLNQKYNQFMTIQQNLRIQLKQQNQLVLNLQSKNNQLLTTLKYIENQINYTRQTMLQINQKYNQATLSQQKLQKQIQNLSNLNRQTQRQIQILLHSDKQKDNIIKQMQFKLHENYRILETHFLIFKQKLHIKQNEYTPIENILQKVLKQIDFKDEKILSLSQTVQALKMENMETIRRQKLREQQVFQILLQNQKLYKDLNQAKHKLHDIVVNYNIKI